MSDLLNDPELRRAIRAQIEIALQERVGSEGAADFAGDRIAEDPDWSPRLQEDRTLGPRLRTLCLTLAREYEE